MRHQEPEYHSRFDASQAPESPSWWARVVFELRKQTLLSFFPHPDSFFYPTRARIAMVAWLNLLSCATLWGYWGQYEHAQFSVYFDFGLISRVGLSVLVLLKLRFKFLPQLKDAYYYPVFLWFALPLFYFLNFFFTDQWPNLERLILVLFLYTNLLHWRVASVGGALAFAAAWLSFKVFKGGSVQVAGLDVFAISTAYIGGLISSYTFSTMDRQRYEQNVRVLHIVGQRLQSALGVQIALSEALRHEAQTTVGAKGQRGLLELADKLDVRANLTRAELQEMEKDTAQLQQLGGTQLLKSVDLVPAVLQELSTVYDWPQATVLQRVKNHCDEGLLVQGEFTETVQMFASLTAVMLRTNADDKDQSQLTQDAPAIYMRCRRGKGVNTLEMSRLAAGQTVPDPKQEAPLALPALNRQEQLQQLLTAENILPAYTLYVIKKMRGSLFLGELEAGTPLSLILSLPAPDILQNRLTGHLPLSLMEMYEQRLL